MAPRKKQGGKTAKGRTPKQVLPKVLKTMLSTEIVVVLDRSASMESIQKDVVAEFDHFIKDQQKIDAPCRVTLWQFDSRGIDLVYIGKPLSEVPGLVLHPRGGTPLLDALGKAVTNTVERHTTLGTTSPDKVLIMVITDGEENASCEWKKPRIKALIKRKQGDGWVFTFLGANVDAFHEAATMGMMVNTTSNYIPDSAGTKFVFAAQNRAVQAFRQSNVVGVDAAKSYTLTNRDPRVQQATEATSTGGATVSTSPDVNGVTTVTTVTSVSQAASIVGMLGNSSGGVARAQSLTPEERSEIAKKAANTRWKRKK